MLTQHVFIRTMIVFTALTLGLRAHTATSHKKTTPATLAPPQLSGDTRYIPTKKSDAPLFMVQDHSERLNYVSNYIFRGISQTNNLPAVQAGFAVTIKNGMYISLFASQDKFKDWQYHTVRVEVDPSIGITKHVNNTLNYDVSITYYHYPNAARVSYNELNAYINYAWLTTQFAYSNDDYATGKSGTYFNLGFKHLIPSELIFNLTRINLSAGIGYSDLPKQTGLRSYQDYNITLNKTADPFIFTLQWTSTNNRSTDSPTLKGSQMTGMISANF